MSRSLSLFSCLFFDEIKHGAITRSRSMLFASLGALVLSLVAPSASAQVCGYCVTPEFCDFGASRFQCRIKLGVGGAVCELAYNKICAINNPTRVGSKDLEGVSAELDEETGFTLAVSVQYEVDELPATYLVTDTQFRALAKENPRAALVLLQLMQEAKSMQTALIGTAFYVQTPTEYSALSGWNEFLASSTVSRAKKEDATEMLRASFNRKANRRGEMVLDMQISRVSVDGSKVLEESFVHLQLQQTYTVRPERLNFRLVGWGNGRVLPPMDLEK